MMKTGMCGHGSQSVGGIRRQVILQALLPLLQDSNWYVRESRACRTRRDETRLIGMLERGSFRLILIRGREAARAWAQ